VVFSSAIVTGASATPNAKTLLNTTYFIGPLLLQTGFSKADQPANFAGSILDRGGGEFM
jgi:hypothetical protein